MSDQPATCGVRRQLGGTTFVCIAAPHPDPPGRDERGGEYLGTTAPRSERHTMVNAHPWAHLSRSA